MSEEQAQRLIQYLNDLESYYLDLNQKEKMIAHTLQEADKTVQSLKAMSDKPKSDALLPIGSGVYVPAKVSSDLKVIVSIGADITMERDMNSAINYLEAQIKEIEIEGQNTSNVRHDVGLQLEQGKAQVNQLIQAQKTNSG